MGTINIIISIHIMLLLTKIQFIANCFRILFVSKHHFTVSTLSLHLRQFLMLKRVLE